MRHVVARPVVYAAAVYVAWTAATYALEGAPRTLLRADAPALRAAYAVIANLVVGLGGGALVLTRLARRGALPAAVAGVRQRWHAVAGIAAGATLGTVVYVVQSPPARPPAVLINGFAQVLPVSAAEVVVCWWLTAAAIAAMAPWLGGWRARALALLPASLLFGVYHLAHSPPFNTAGMMTLLMGVGLLTGAFYLGTGDIAGTIVLHNFLALYGVLDAMDRLGGAQAPGGLDVPLVGMAVVTLAVVAAVMTVVRRAAGRR